MINVSPCISRRESVSISRMHTLPDSESEALFISKSGCEPDSENSPRSFLSSQAILI